jgi:hypothetical protein
MEERGGSGSQGGQHILPQGWDRSLEERRGEGRRDLDEANYPQVVA